MAQQNQKFKMDATCFTNILSVIVNNTCTCNTTYCKNFVIIVTTLTTLFYNLWLVQLTKMIASVTIMVPVFSTTTENHSWKKPTQILTLQLLMLPLKKDKQILYPGPSWQDIIYDFGYSLNIIGYVAAPRHRYSDKIAFITSPVTMSDRM